MMVVRILVCSASGDAHHLSHLLSSKIHDHDVCATVAHPHSSNKSEKEKQVDGKKERKKEKTKIEIRK